MAVNSNSALLRGLGPLGEVADYLCNLPTSEAGKAAAIRKIIDGLGMLDDYADGNEVVIVLLCGAMNKHFRETGYLWRLDDNGRATQNYIGMNDGRSAIADLAGL